MTFLRMVFIVCIISLFACSALENRQHMQKTDEMSYKSVHLSNLPPEVTESQLISFISEINQALNKLEYPASGYQLWKIHGDSNSEYKYLWEGLWPNEAAYESIHKIETVRNIQEKYIDMIKAMNVQVYWQYSKISIAITHH